MDHKAYIETVGQKARAAEGDALALTQVQKNNILSKIAAALRVQSETLIEANSMDLGNAQQSGMRPAMIDRLTLDAARIEGIAQSLEEIVELKDPVGEIMDGWVRPNGLQIIRKRVPIGVIGIIYEARPNVTVDAAALCIKTGNVVILRGGSDAFMSNRALVKLMRQEIAKLGHNPDIVQLVEDPSRDATTELMQAVDYLDLLIPRGGAGLIQAVKRNARVPVIETGAGNCHAYVDRSADLHKALEIVVNAKCSRPSVCNAIETLLVHREIAEPFLHLLHRHMGAKVQFYGCERTREILKNSPLAPQKEILPATEAEYATEFNDYVLAIKVVDSYGEAIAHINKYSTKHSEVVITEDLRVASAFQSKVRSAVVYVNASTRFTDGGEFGFGAEIGIATGKLHARGPMGLNELTTIQYLVTGTGQTR